MAKKNNEVLARVAIHVDNVEASRKHLKTLEDAALNFRLEIHKLQERITALTKSGAAANAIAPFVERLNAAKASLKDTNKLIAAQEAAIGKYADIMDHLSDAPLVQLQQGMRSLQANMKQTLTAGDVKRYAELRAAYDELLATIEQLNGKAPNIGYVLSNVGEVADRTLSSSIEYMEKLVNSVDRTTQRGQENLKKWTAQLNSLRQEQDRRGQRIAATPTDFSAKEVRAELQRLEQEAANIQLGNTEDIRENAEQVERLKQALSASADVAENSWIEATIQKVKAGDASIEDMQRALKALREQLQRTPSSKKDLIEGIRTKIDVIQPALANTEKALKGVGETLSKVKTDKLKDVPLKNLREAAEFLKKELEQLPPTLEDFGDKSEQLKILKSRMQEVEEAAKDTKTTLDKAVSRLANWVTVYMGFDKVTALFRKAFSTTLELTDAMSDVRKTTGLAADEVARLTEEIQKVDTRVSNQKLMEAATEAGRLGLKAMEDVYAFTKASAITLTALDELDARSITSVMKLNSLLGETDRLGVQQAILSTASSINELSMASSAAQQPIIDFSRRYGGIAAQAHIATSEVLALGATIDALGQPVEMSSTALNKFTTALLTNTRTIAEDTGLSEEYLNNLIRQGNAMEAMIEVLSRLGAMGGLDRIANYIGDMGGEGARMTAVISALASNIGFLREQVALSGLAFEEGTSVIDEYNIKNENAAAMMERIGNRFYEIFANPSRASVLTWIVRQLLDFTNFITSSHTAARLLRLSIVALIAQLLRLSSHYRLLNKWVYTSLVSLKNWVVSLKDVPRKLMAATLSLRSATAATSLFTKAVGLLKTGLSGLWRLLNTMLATNPVGLIMLAVGAVYEIISAITATTESTLSFVSATEKAQQALEEENYKLLQLRRRMEELIAKGGTLSEIISTLNRDYADQLGYTISLAAGQREVAGAIDLVTAAMQRQIAQQQKSDIVNSVQEKYREQFTDAQSELKEFLNETAAEGRAISADVQKELRSAIYTDLATSALNGSAQVGANTRRVVEQYAEAVKETVIQRGGGKELAEKAYRAELEFWTERITESDEIEDLAKLYNKRSADILDQTQEADLLISAADKALTDARKKQISTINEENNLLSKAAQQMNDTDVAALKNVIELQQDVLAAMKVADQGYEALAQSLQQNKETVRQALFAWIENPLKGVEKYRNENGKWVKDLDKQGNPQFVAAEQYADLTTAQLQALFKRNTQEHDFLMREYQSNLEDVELPKYARMLAATNEKIKQTLAARGEKISESDFAISLFNPKESSGGGDGGGNKEQDIEMRKSYTALLEQINAFFNRRKQIIQQNYKDSSLTPAEYERQLIQLEAEKRDALADMQASLLGQAAEFDKEFYAIDVKNFEKVSNYIAGVGRNFRRTVEGDLQESRAAILQEDIKLQEQRRQVAYGNNYQAQVDADMQAAFEKADLFWGSETERTVELAQFRLFALRQEAEDAYRINEQALLERLEQNRTFGDAFKKLTAGQQQDLINLLRQYHDRTIEADKKFADERRKLTEHIWKAVGGERAYEEMAGALDLQEKELSFQGSAGAFAYPQQQFNAQQEMILKRIALEEWAAEQQIIIARRTGETQEQLAQREMEIAQKRQEAQQAIVDNYMDRMGQLADITSSYGTMIGEGFAGMLAGEEEAGKNLLKNLAVETVQMIGEFAKRLIIQQTFGDMMAQVKQQQLNQQTAAAYSAAMQEVGIEVAKMAAIEAAATGKITAQSLAQPDSILTWGSSGMARAGVLIGLVSLATAAAIGLINSLFPGSADEAKPSKKLATGMKTYADGRYPVQGDDGRTYHAQFHPTIKTGVYDGGSNGKAHMALFSEVMPEMVISGPATRIIRQNYPELMNAIMLIDKYGYYPSSRIRTYANGNVPQTHNPQPLNGYPSQPLNGSTSQPLNDSTVNGLRTAILMLTEQLQHPVPPTINMYGPGGLQESSQKADDFYNRHRRRKRP